MKSRSVGGICHCEFQSETLLSVVNRVSMLLHAPHVHSLPKLENIITQKSFSFVRK